MILSYLYSNLTNCPQIGLTRDQTLHLLVCFLKFLKLGQSHPIPLFIML